MINKKDLKIETMRGKGKGGQRKNKLDNCVRITHIPTGISVVKDGRSQAKNKEIALQELKSRLKKSRQKEQASKKKARRDKAIKTRDIIRTYDFKSGIVKNHLNNKKASIKDILQKGKIDLLR